MLSSIVDKLIDLSTDYQRKKALLVSASEELRTTCLLSRYYQLLDEIKIYSQESEAALYKLLTHIESLKGLQLQ